MRSNSRLTGTGKPLKISRMMKKQSIKGLDEILKKLKAARPELARDFGVKRMAVFGSYARGAQRKDSEVDILVEVDPSIRLAFINLANRIEEILGQRAHVISKRAIKPRSWKIIEKELIDVP